MSSPVLVNFFVEDRAHESFLVPMLRRAAQEEKVVVDAMLLVVAR